MFAYPKNLRDSKLELDRVLSMLAEQGYIIKTHKEPIGEYDIDKITISKQADITNRIVISSGLHGIEGYIGHVCQMHFLTNILDKVDANTEIIMYHIINPHGLDNYRRFNVNNVDLNRNYSKNGFELENDAFIKVHSFLAPRKLNSIFGSNIWFYTTVIRNIIKHSIKTMNLAILKGQKVDSKSIYYSGTKYEPSTKYIIKELDSLYSNVALVLWIDLHSGYGNKYQMSIINSRYETKTTKELKENLQYKSIIGYENDTMYDTDGDITEKLYQEHQNQDHNSSLLALCYEFGTIGNSLFDTLRTFKTILFENNITHFATNKKMKEYQTSLMKKAFLPNSTKWKTNAIEKFEQATIELLKYKKLI